MEQPKFGCRLVGMIPCDDAFGVDLIVDKYEEAIEINKKKIADRQNLLMSSAVMEMNEMKKEEHEEQADEEK